MSATKQPAAGPMLQAVVKLDVGGKKHLHVLALIAAYIDAGNDRPPTAELASRLGWKSKNVGRAIQRLEGNGFLVVHRDRSRGRKRPATRRYEIPTAGAPRTSRSAPRPAERGS